MTILSECWQSPCWTEDDIHDFQFKAVLVLPATVTTRMPQVIQIQFGTVVGFFPEGGGLCVCVWGGGGNLTKILPFEIITMIQHYQIFG